jgi:7-carboxy-7-deazaguanine synthase
MNLRRAGRHVTIETAGTRWQAVECDLMSISPKLSNSTPARDTPSDWWQRHEATRHRPAIVQQLLDAYRHQLKFVVAAPADVDEVVAYLRLLTRFDRQHVLLMPEGTDPVRLTAIGNWLEAGCLRHGFTFCPRRQIEWFGLVRGT